MYTPEQIKCRLEETTDDLKRLYLFTHLISQIMLLKKIENCSEEECLEAFIFTTFFFYEGYSYKKNLSNDEILKIVRSWLIEYRNEFFELSILNDWDIIELITLRFPIIRSEIVKMNENERYLFPYLLYNLYINPLNRDTLSMDEVMKKVFVPDWLKLTAGFKLKFNDFLESVRYILHNWSID